MSRPGRATSRGQGTTPGSGRWKSDGEPRSHPNGRSDSADAFIADPGDGPAAVPDDLAEILAEDFVRSITTGEYSDEALEEVVDEEIGGPFVTTSAREEFAEGTDESNPADAEAEPLPRAVGGLSQAAIDEGMESEAEEPRSR
jgi:hypothetical protein